MTNPTRNVAYYIIPDIDKKIHVRVTQFTSENLLFLLAAAIYGKEAINQNKCTENIFRDLTSQKKEY